MEQQEQNRQQFGDIETDRLDEDFLTAMDYGMPPAGGVGIGIDRLAMMITGVDNIKDIILFPALYESKLIWTSYTFYGKTSPVKNATQLFVDLFNLLIDKEGKDRFVETLRQEKPSWWKQAKKFHS